MNTIFTINDKNKLDLTYLDNDEKRGWNKNTRPCAIMKIVDGDIKISSPNNTIDVGPNDYDPIISAICDNIDYYIVYNYYSSIKTVTLKYMSGISFNQREFNALYDHRQKSEPILYMQWLEKSDTGEWYYKNSNVLGKLWEPGRIITIIGLGPLDIQFKVVFTQCSDYDDNGEAYDRIIINREELILGDNEDEDIFDYIENLDDFMEILSDLKDKNNQMWEDFFMKDYIEKNDEELDIPMALRPLYRDYNSTLIKLDDGKLRFINKGKTFEYKGHTFKFLGTDGFIIDSNTDTKYSYKDALYILCLLKYPDLELDPYTFDINPKQSNEDAFKIEKFEKQFKK